ncbi:hypothetical protein M885DRAFT_547893 [Pelagophyceae sp. CCMP2097]|nr:hypothetical protein M885DRAFT_547893 [Pelagophyceae sp. CCMP2097]
MLPRRLALAAFHGGVRRAFHDRAQVLRGLDGDCSVLAKIDSSSVTLRIESTWDDHPSVHLFGGIDGGPAVARFGFVGKALQIESDFQSAGSIFVSLPQRFSVAAESRGTVYVVGTIEGNVDVAARKIRADKLRGDFVRLRATDAVVVQKLVEATNVRIESPVVTLARVVAHAAALTARGPRAAVRVDAAYCAALTIDVGDDGAHDDGAGNGSSQNGDIGDGGAPARAAGGPALWVGTLHGAASAAVRGGPAQVHRITGSVDVTCDGDVEANFDALSGFSALRSARGNVRVRLASEACVASVRLRGTDVAVDCDTFASHAPAAEATDGPCTDGAPCAKVVSGTVDAVRGSAPPRPLGRGGKIDARAAADQRWVGAVSTASAASEAAPGALPTALAATALLGTVSLRKCGWVDAIKLAAGLGRPA